MELLYIANPLCSWCYGFGPSLRRLRARWPQLAITLALGSLGEARLQRPWDADERARLRAHWRRIQTLTGLPFAFGWLEREDFIPDFRPACRALLVVRACWPALVLPFFERLQERFYARGADITDPALLRAVAVGEFGTPEARFDALFADPALAQALGREFAQVARLGVRGFPTLLALAGDRLRLVTAGWLGPDELIRRVEEVATGLGVGDVLRNSAAEVETPAAVPPAEGR